MRLQVLVSAMNQTDFSIIDKMNINSDAIIINQCERNNFFEIKNKGNNIKFMSLKEIGVGLSRNTALMRADADVVLFSDEDVIYYDNYKKDVLNAFKDPSVDICFFNIKTTTPGKDTYINKESKKTYFFNSFRYGTVRIAARLETIRLANIHFSLLFGGGARYSAGEDTIFIADCIKKRLKMVTSTAFIGEVSHNSSSWFNGFTDKYFIDKGVLFRHISPKFGHLLCLQFAIRHKDILKKHGSVLTAYKLMLKGLSLTKFPK